MRTLISLELRKKLNFEDFKHIEGIREDFGVSEPDWLFIDAKEGESLKDFLKRMLLYKDEFKGIKHKILNIAYFYDEEENEDYVFSGEFNNEFSKKELKLIVKNDFALITSVYPPDDVYLDSDFDDDTISE